MNGRTLSVLVVLAFGFMACRVFAPAAPTVSPATPTPAATATSAPTAAAPTSTPLPSGNGPCMVESAAGITSYTRPSLLADVFSTVALTPPVMVGLRTADGWLGFDPAKAQAANIGVFRLRWIAPEAQITLSGDCASVPTAEWVPEPGVCYEMVMGPVEVHASADPNSAVNGTLNVGDFAAILGKTPTGWLFVNGDEANSPGIVGFIPELEANVNGPCDSIPTVSP